MSISIYFLYGFQKYHPTLYQMMFPITSLAKEITAHTETVLFSVQKSIKSFNYNAIHISGNYGIIFIHFST